MYATQVSPVPENRRFESSRRHAMGATGSNRRRFSRLNTHIAAKVFCKIQFADCTVLDISADGARIKPHDAIVPREFAIQIAGIGTVPGRVVWRKKGQIGLQFKKQGRHVFSRIVSYLENSLASDPGPVTTSRLRAIARADVPRDRLVLDV